MNFAKSFAMLACALLCGLSQADARQQEPSPPDRSTAAVQRPPSINARPFIELAETGRMSVETGRVGPETMFDVTATAELNEDGTFKPESVKLEWRETPSAEVTALAQQWLTALSQSKILTTLRGAKVVRITTRLGRETVALGLETELASEREAREMASGYDVLLALARMSKRGAPEESLYQAFKLDSDGKVFRLAFEMPKVTVAKIVADMLDRRAERNQN